MADKIKAIKIKQENGTYSEEIPISVNVQNVQWDENNHTLLDVLGSVDISSSGKGNLQHQIDELDGDKISTNEFNSRLNDFLKDQISADTTDWLDDNVNPVGSAVIVDKTLTIEGAAADAKAVGDELTAVKADLADVTNHASKSAEQLISDKRTVNKVPYKYRASQSGKSDRAYDCIVGGTVCFNQILQNGDFSNETNGWITKGTEYGTLSASDGICTYTIGSTQSDLTYIARMVNLISEHVYACIASINPSKQTSCRFLNSWVANGSASKVFTANTWGKLETIVKTKQALQHATIYVNTASDLQENDTVAFKHIMFMDLTAMFGIAIADYIYTLEQSKEGAGVSLFKQMFPNEYYPYNAGELISVEGLSAHVMRDADDNIVGSYPLDSTLTLRGVPVLKNGKVEFDGDTYEADGTVTRRYAERVYQSGDESLANAITDGTNTVYKLSVETTETAIPYASQQVVNPYGTEEYISETICPVGHITEYPDNLRAKIDGLPWDLSMIAPVETAYTATRNYTVNQLLIVDNTLYKVTSNIANGGAITPNSNVTATTLSEVIASLS